MFFFTFCKNITLVKYKCSVSHSKKKTHFYSDFIPYCLQTTYEVFLTLNDKTLEKNFVKADKIIQNLNREIEIQRHTPAAAPPAHKRTQHGDLTGLILFLFRKERLNSTISSYVLFAVLLLTASRSTPALVGT